jgi:SAM-dependent methyltransferase
LADFLIDFGQDVDVRDLLYLDVLAASVQESTSGGIAEAGPALMLHPSRLWEYAALYKGLRLFNGGLDVLDLGGPASHLVLLSALAKNRVISVDRNPGVVETGRRCARRMGLDTLEHRVGDLRDLSEIQTASFDRVVCCSVLQNLTVSDQEQTLSEIGRILRPGGIVGLTFDYGIRSQASEEIFAPHEPPDCQEELVRRYVRGGLEIVGNRELENPIPGALFRDPVVRYAIGSLFLGKPPLENLRLPEATRSRGSQISGLVIRDLPYRLFCSASRQARLSQRIEELEQAAAERLQALQVAQVLMEGIQREANRREQGLHNLTATLSARDERIEELERAAAERLQALEKAQVLMEGIQREADRREQGLHDLTATIRARDQRIEELERAAAERLQALERAQVLMEATQTEADQREGALEKLSAVLEARDARIDELDRAARELIESIRTLRSRGSDLEAEIQALRTQSVIDFLRRRMQRS